MLKSVPCGTMSASDALALVLSKQKIAIRLPLGYAKFILYTAVLSTHWIQWLDWVLKEPTVTEGERCVPGELPEKTAGEGWGGEGAGRGGLAQDQSSEGRPDLLEQKGGKPNLERLPGGGGIYAGSRIN